MENQISMSTTHTNNKDSSYRSNLIYCFAGAISSPQQRSYCTKLIKELTYRIVKGHSGSEG